MMIDISKYTNLKLMPILEFHGWRPHYWPGVLVRGLESMLTVVAASPSEAITSVGNNRHGVHQFTPVMR